MSQDSARPDLQQCVLHPLAALITFLLMATCFGCGSKNSNQNDNNRPDGSNFSANEANTSANSTTLVKPTPDEPGSGDPEIDKRATPTDELQKATGRDSDTASRGVVPADKPLDFYLERAASLESEIMYDAAVDHLDQALRLDPDNRGALFSKGRCLEFYAWSLWSEDGLRDKRVRERFLDGARALKKAVKNSEDLTREDRKIYVNSMLHSAMVYSIQGESDLAVSNLQAALEAGFRDFGVLEQDEFRNLRENDLYPTLRDLYQD